MTNWFAGIGQSSSGLDAARYGLSVVSQNIENADTPGYSRQASEQGAIDGSPTVGLYTSRAGAGGLNGVTVLRTTRTDDPVLDARMRAEHSRSAAADTSATGMAQLEQILPEPSADGVSARLAGFWTAWSAVANNPGDAGTRSVLLSNATAAAGAVRSLSDALGTVTQSTSTSLDGDLASATDAAHSLASLNGQIAVAAATGQNANALLDQRDGLLDTLSTLVGGVATIAANGTADVSVGGQPLVTAGTASSLAADPTSHQVSVGGTAVTLAGGSAGARVTALTSTIPGFSAQLDAVANTLIAAGNSAQAGGYDLAGNPGAALFGGSGAAGISVVLTDPAGIAASSSPGGNLDGSNAAAAATQGAATGSPDALYASMVGGVAGASASAQQQQGTQDLITSNVDALHASVNGVSYDDEVSQMLTYQHAFAASSRVLTTIDQMLDTLINHTGMVGLA